MTVNMRFCQFLHNKFYFLFLFMLNTDECIEKIIKDLMDKKICG